VLDLVRVILKTLQAKNLRGKTLSKFELPLFCVPFILI